jgi:hypothetical protein
VSESLGGVNAARSIRPPTLRSSRQFGRASCGSAFPGSPQQGDGPRVRLDMQSTGRTSGIYLSNGPERQPLDLAVRSD